MEYSPQERGYRIFFKYRFKIVSYEAIVRLKDNFSWTFGERLRVETPVSGVEALSDCGACYQGQGSKAVRSIK